MDGVPAGVTRQTDGFKAQMESPLERADVSSRNSAYNDQDGSRLSPLGARFPSTGFLVVP